MTVISMLKYITRVDASIEPDYLLFSRGDDGYILFRTSNGKSDEYDENPKEFPLEYALYNRVKRLVNTSHQLDGTEGTVGQVSDLVLLLTRIKRNFKGLTLDRLTTIVQQKAAHRGWHFALKISHYTNKKPPLVPYNKFAYGSERGVYVEYHRRFTVVFEQQLGRNKRRVFKQHYDVSDHVIVETSRFTTVLTRSSLMTIRQALVIVKNEMIEAKQRALAKELSDKLVRDNLVDGEDEW